jgi:acyl carrier protein
MEIASRVRTFINEEILHGEDGVVATDQSPLLDGTLDSVGLMQLVAFLEEEFDIEIDDAEIVPEHFSSVTSIETLVRRRIDEKGEAEVS